MDEESISNGSSPYNLLLILPVALSAIWIILDLFYASWLLAFIANFIINALLPKGTGIHIDRINISLLTGRIIFKNLQYCDRDQSVFITDGYGILRWWKKEPINDSTVKCKACGSLTKTGVGKQSLIFLQLNGLEYHWYNRKEVYDEWGKPKTEENDIEESNGMSWIKQIRPSFHCSINKGRIMFGNKLTERTLVIYFHHAEGQYQLTEASNTYDELMHKICWHGDKLRAILEPSVGYTGPQDDVPSCAEVTSDGHDNGYLLLKTDSAEGVYSLDIPGLVPMNDSSSPKFAFDVFLGSNSVINYGSYANRQRINLIQKFFFPNDYTTRPVTRIPQPGERRIFTSFDVSVFIVSNATLNLFFEEKKEIRCLTFRVGGDSSVSVYQPWITKENGYTTTLKGKATDIEILTSLPYETLGRCQSFDVSADLYFPRVWNVTQKWDMKFGLSHVQGSILFQYIDFFNALIDDWLGNDPPDILEFIPVDWNVGIDMSNYEIYLHTSPYNWIDITTEGKENSRIAFCGKTGHMSLELPFTEFLPKEQRVNFTAHGQNIVLRRYIPPSCSSRDSQFHLSSCCKHRWRVMDPPKDRTPLVEKKLMRSLSQPLETFEMYPTQTKSDNDTFGEGITKSDSFKRTHIRRGSEPLLTRTQVHNIPLREMGGRMGHLLEETGDNEETELTEKLLRPTRAGVERSNEFFPMGYRMETMHESGWLDFGCGPDLMIEISYKGHNYDPSHYEDGREEEKRLVPSEVHVNVEASSVLLRVFGSLAKDLLALRDNFPGEYMYFKTYFSESTSAPDGTAEDNAPIDFTKPPNLSSGPNVPEERFLNVIVDFKLHNIMGELPAHLPEDYPADFPLVSGISELFSVHVDYTEAETCVQLHIDPISVNLPSHSAKGLSSSDYSLGYLVLSSVDFSCHGFTELLLLERVEYAWMMKLDLGEIMGSVSAQQLLPVVDFFQTAANHALSYGDDYLKAPDAIIIEPPAEPLSELLKYKLFALNISTIDVNIKEKDTLINLKSPGFALDLCNLHSNVQTLAVSLQLHHLIATAFIATPTNASVLMGCGHADIGPIRGDVGLREPEQAMAERQLKFLRRADSRSSRLWFVWDDQYACGCCGGCQFLSSSINRVSTPRMRDRLKDLPLEGLYGAMRDRVPTPPLATPSQSSFKSLKTLQYLHSTVVWYHFSVDRQKDTPLEETPGRLPSTSSLPSFIPEDNGLSQESDNDSFHSAIEYFGNDDLHEELFHSINNTPRASVKHHSRQSSKQSIQAGIPLHLDGNRRSRNFPPVNPSSSKNLKFVSHYEKVLNSYRCSWKTVKLYRRAGMKESPPTESKSASGQRFMGGATPKRGRRKDDSNARKFILEVPVFTSSLEQLPFVLRSHYSENQPPANSKGRDHRRQSLVGDNSAMFSVEVGITGFDIFLSPPFIPLIERYIECANLFFTTRTAHLLLEILSLEGLGSVESHLKKIKNTSLAIPSSMTSPLAHLSVTMDTSSYGSIQILQMCKVLRSPGLMGSEGMAPDSSYNYRSSLVCLYTSGFQGNALIHHNSNEVNLDTSNEDSISTNLQMTLKLAGRFCLPVLQAGLFAINFSAKGDERTPPRGITPNYSFLDFTVEPSSVLNKNQSVSITNIGELSMNKLLLTTTAKIIQSEFSSSPILMWSDIGVDKDMPPPDKESADASDQRNSEQTNNSLVIHMSVPSVRLQLSGPKHGIPSAHELCIDSSWLFGLIEIWKPLIEDFVQTVKRFWRNKITRDRQLIMSLITAAMDMSYRQKPRNPLLTSLSCSLRESVVYTVTQQLWQGLPMATTERLAGFPTVYQEGFLLQEIVATLISLSLRLNVQGSSLSAIPCVGGNLQMRPSIFSEDATLGYFSISPSASELAITNASYSKQEYENIDYTTLVNAVDNTEALLYIREALLPFFSACNIRITPQLNKQCHNSLKLNVDYHIQLEEAAILVIDGREDTGDSVDDSVGVVPEFLLDHLCITGSLEHVVESRFVVQSSGHLVTIRSNSDNNDRKKHHSNVTSKCYLGLDAIATHVTLPLLMLSRHTSQSLHHWRKSFHAFKPTVSSSIHSMGPAGQSTDSISQPVTESQSWITAQSLVSILIEMERSKLHTTPSNNNASQSKQATPRGSNRNTNISTHSSTPNYPLSLKALGTISKMYGIEEPDTKRRHSSSSSAESPTKPTIPPSSLETGNTGILSSGSHGIEGTEDTTDSANVFSSDPEAPIQASMATYATRKGSTSKGPVIVNPTDFVPDLSPVAEMPNMNEILAIPDNQLEFSVYGSIRIQSLQVSSQVGTLLVMFEVRNISGAIDCRQIPSVKKKADINIQTGPAVSDHTPLLYKLLPTYLSVSSTLQQCCIRVFDSAVSDGDLAVLSANPLELCTSLYYGNMQPAPAYRSLFRLPKVQLDLKEPPIVLHKKFHRYIPTFTSIYNEVFAPATDSIIDDKFFAAAAPSVVSVSDLHFPPHLPRGSFLFHLAWFQMIIKPLSSLTVKYQLTPVTAQLGTSSVVKFSMNIGRHNLEFTPKESKDELSLRNVPLPAIALKGSVIPRLASRLPSISAELAMKQVVVDITTDVFNQLLVLQTSFIKELNDLLNMFLNIGESLPQEKLSSINIKQSTESGFELISLLSSIKLSLQGIKITISTPTQTALRFSTGKQIEMMITNPSHQTVHSATTDRLNVIPIDQLTLHGKVETEISISLGCLQDDTGADEEDDFIELAYFKTWITIKNTLQQNTSLLNELGEGSINYPASLDTFHISIMAPHLYIQSTAVEKAILFWVNCKSVYNFWQNEHKLLNAEVQAATEEFVELITKPSTQIKAPSFDFSKPRLVQITVNDVGACMPLIALPTTPHSSQKGFPALVFTIKDMQVTLNLSKKLGSVGKFSDFCVRFDERFHFRHKTWTVDPRKHKFLNYGEVPKGTYRFCIVNKPRDDDGGGEKLFSAFTWHMSGINTKSTTHIGRHISTLVRTLTAIGSDMEESHNNTGTTSSVGSPSSLSQSPKPLLRTSSKRRYSYSIIEEQDVLRSLEVDLAIQTRKLQKLRQSGATPDSLKNEEDNFHKLEVDIARGLRRVFRKGRGMSFQQWSQLLYPRSPVVASHLRDSRKRFGTLPRRRMVTFEDELTPDLPSMSTHPLHKGNSPRTHARHRSDITPDVRRLMKNEEGFVFQESVSRNLDSVIEGNENNQESGKVGGAQNKGMTEPTKVSEPLIPSIDIEVNVTINIDSGQMALLSEDTSSHDQRPLTSFVSDSPLLSGRRTKQSPPSVHTVLFIPALEVKAHYQSILGTTYSTAPPSPSRSMAPPSPSRPMAPTTMSHSNEDQLNSNQHQMGATPRQGVTTPRTVMEIDDKTGLPIKRGILSIAAIVSSLPNDLELNPSVLDFIEQVVRPINISAQEIENVSPADLQDNDDEDEDELPVVVAKSNTRPISFPVDVCLNFQIHPSKIILTCNPHARVRCQVAIPTVSFVVSCSLFSKRQYDSQTLTVPPSRNESSTSQSRNESSTSQSRNESSTSQSRNESSTSQSPSDSSIGSHGMDDIITINNINVTGCLQTFQLTMFTPNVQSSLIQPAQSEDKEVISLVLGQAFVHLSRSSVFVQERPSCKSVDDYMTIEKLKVSVVPHIESLILFYDWRRLNDVTWFRKCWYNTGLVEALFIGRKRSEEPTVPHSSPPYNYPGEPAVWSPGSSVEDSSTDPSTIETSNTITAELVVAVSVADMRLTANVAQLMGNAYIQVSHLRGEAHADIKNNELAFLNVDSILEELEIDAQGGVVAGNVHVKDTSICLFSSSQIGCIPEHKASVHINTIEGHIDYMSAIILLVNGTGVKVRVWDSWEGINLDSSEHAAAKIQVCCSFDWSTCQISVHRATAKGMFGIIQRIYDFIVQQKKRSERMIGSMIPAGTTASTIFAAYQAEQKRAEKSRAAEIENPLLEYHHWMWAVKVGSIRLMNALGIQISTDQHDVSLGGFINVSGDVLSVVCFHGTSFREKEWAVFNIDLISAKFSTLAIPGLGSIFLSETDPSDGLDTATKRRICQQVCVLELGDESSQLTELAAIYRVMAGRGGVQPVLPMEISEWLNYVCINHHLNSIHGAVVKPVGYLKESQKLSINTICCLPAFSFKLINDHLWPSLRQLEEQIMNGLTESATVECTLVTKFSDGIAVTTTVENYLFLHDLFKAYIEYLDKQNVSFRPPFTVTQTMSANVSSTDEEEKMSNCLRRFVSVHWELDPRIVLLATAQWASGHFNPHITWVLETLGFKQARTTIPKYIQRGLMDPLDLGIAAIVELLIELSATKKVKSIDPSSL